MGVDTVRHVTYVERECQGIVFNVAMWRGISLVAVDVHRKLDVPLCRTSSTTLPQACFSMASCSNVDK